MPAPGPWAPRLSQGPGRLVFQRSRVPTKQGVHAGLSPTSSMRRAPLAEQGHSIRVGTLAPMAEAQTQLSHNRARTRPAGDGGCHPIRKAISTLHNTLAPGFSPQGEGSCATALMARLRLLFWAGEAWGLRPRK